MRWTEIVIILTILMAIALFAAARYLDTSTQRFMNTKSPKHLRDFATFRAALNVFRFNHGRFPSTAEGLRALVEQPAADDIKNYEPSLKAEIADPWGNRYHYRNPPMHNDEFPDIWSSGPDERPDTDDDLRNWDQRL